MVGGHPALPLVVVPGSQCRGRQTRPWHTSVGGFAVNLKSEQPQKGTSPAYLPTGFRLQLAFSLFPFLFARFFLESAP